MKYKISLPQVFSLIMITLAGVVYSVAAQFPLVIGFIPGFVVLVFFAKKEKRSFKQILHICLQGINKTKIVIFILFLVSFILPSWYLSGTINQMVSIALHFMSPSHFILLSFIAALLFSMLLGTAIGTLSSIGIPILGTAMVLHLPIAVVSGAVISGAFVGDRTSPFSSSHQLLAHTLELPIKKQGRALLFTTLTAILVCLCFYGGADYVLSIKAKISIAPILFNKGTLLKLLPPIILILIVLFRIKIIYAFLSSIFASAVIAYMNGITLFKIASAFWNGIPGLGGGFAHMYELLLFLALAGAYNGLLEELNIIQPYLDMWLQSSKSLIGDTIKTIVATLIISFIAANQTLPIILTGRSFLPHWSKKYGKTELARVMGDTTMLFPGMVPWSVLTIMCSSIVGVPLLKYVPFALFLWSLPLITIIFSLFKQKRQRSMVEVQTTTF